MRLDKSHFPDGRHVLFEALIQCSEPPEELTVSQWADRFRKVAAESGSPRPGDWVTDFMPHTREPMDCLHPDHPAQSVTLKWAAQLAKTEIGVNWFGFIVDRAPGPMLTMLPSLDEAIKYNRVKLQTAIDASPRIRHRIRAENQRDEAASTTSFKRFAGGFNQIVTASSSKGLQMVSIRFFIAEEVTGYPLDTDGRGSPLKQAEARQKAYDANKKKLISGTPGLAGICQITASYEAGDRRQRYVACPECAARQVLTEAALQPPSESTGHRPTFACLACGFLITEDHKEELLLGGVWVPTIPLPPEEEDGQPIPVPEVFPGHELERYACPPCEGRCQGIDPSYDLWTAYSPLESWLSLWKEGVEARKSPLTLKVYTQQYLGRAWQDAESQLDHERLHAARLDMPARLVPLDRPLLTGFIDIQGDRLEWGVWSWGPHAVGGLIDRGIIPHAPETAEAAAGIDELLSRQWRSTTGGVAEPARWGIDTSAYSNWARGIAAGRGHKLLACEGAESRKAPVWGTPKKREVKDRFGRVLSRVMVYPTGVFDLKHTVMRGLSQLIKGPSEAGGWLPGTLLLPAEIVDEAYCRQLTAEVCIDPQQQAKGNARRKLHERPGDHRMWVKRSGWANEGLDIAVGCRALAWSLNVDTMTDAGWDRWRARLAPPDDAGDLFAAMPAAPATDPNDYFARLAALNNSE